VEAHVGELIFQGRGGGVFGGGIGEGIQEGKDSEFIR
jgi:hypothetical protein